MYRELNYYKYINSIKNKIVDLLVNEKGRFRIWIIFSI
jgi:hypothetical protein